MIVIFGGDSAVAPSPLPADLVKQLDGAEAIVLLDPLTFPFEALPVEDPRPLLLRFDETVVDSPDEIWAQLGEVVLSKLTTDEVVIAPADLLAMLRSRASFGATTGRSDEIDATAAVDLASTIDTAVVAKQRAVRQGVAEVLLSATSEVPRGREPQVAWVDGGAGFLATELVNTSVSADHKEIDIGLISLALAGQSAEDQQVMIAVLWEYLRPGGSLIIVDAVGGPGPALQVDNLLDTIASVSNHQVTLADLKTITPKVKGVSKGVSDTPFTIAVARVVKLGGVAALKAVSARRHSQPVFVVANDVVPGLGMPSAAPGLRATGFVAGLRVNGVDATLITPVGNRPSPWRSDTPPPSHADTVVVRPLDLRAFLTSRAPATVVITNSNALDEVIDIDEIDLVFDLFAPKVLELECSVPPASPKALDGLRDRKRRALSSSVAYVVNGDKKLPYLNALLDDAGVRPEIATVVAAKMAVPGTASTAPADGPLRLAMTGYVQRWSRPGSWLDTIARQLSADMVLSALVATHWGDRAQESVVDLGALDGSAWVRKVPPLEFEAFASFLASQHVVVDLFDQTAERELAMVTRTVVALASGTPVIHPPFTEVSPLIAEYNAGWLVDPDDDDGLTAVLQQLSSNRAEVQERSANARQLWADHFEPGVATASMADLLVAVERRRLGV